MFVSMQIRDGLLQKYYVQTRLSPLIPQRLKILYGLQVVPATFHTASIWLTLALAVQRSVSFCV